jgi:hypothetical protein
MRKLMAVALACATMPVYGWGPEGHSLVARIADAQLTPAARARVADILGSGTTMASISSWADQIRRERAKTASWHYIDIPIDKPRLDMARDCQQGDCVVAQILAERDVLRDPSATAVQRREALMFLIHFVGDMHQPLHSSDNKDKGGNNVHVVLFDRPGNLHGTWDSGLLNRMPKEAELYPVLLQEAQKRRKKYSKGSVADWAEESHKLAQKVVYGKLPPEPPGTAEPLGADYEKFADPVIREQLEKAGDRLAKLLNDTLK